MKTTIRTLIALLLVVAGLTRASADEVADLVPAPAPEVEQPQALADETAGGDEQELTLGDLLAMDPDKLDAGGCCMADCMAERSACNNACGSNMACRQQCAQQFEACASKC